ncbi:efflux RND transporter periplasmic adaptor subunit [candidate division TA06 bacterium]|nr:efflux RND transporter periplasmic adaptor subunit [candidate division TA06 bacterium]
MEKQKILLGGGVFVSLLIVSFYFGMKTGSVRSRANPPEVNETGHPENGGVEETGIFLSEEAKANIGLVTEQADFQTISEVIRVNGVVKAHPNRSAFASTRIEGRVHKVYANLGDWVKKGEILVEIESRAIGNPPPVVPVKSPLSGKITNRRVTLGEPVEPSDILFEIMDLSIVLIEGDVFEDQLARIQNGQDVRIRAMAYSHSEEVFTGQVSYIGDVLDPEKRTAHIWVEVKNKEEKLKPEMFTELSVVVQKGSDVLAVPREAVLEEGGERFVFIQDGDLYKRQNIVLGMKDDQYVQVMKGLFPGDLVVTRGNYELSAARATSKAPAGEDDHSGHVH